MNAQTKHTPGPWMWNPEGDETVVRIPMRTGEQDFSVLGVSELATVEDYANARLIASAPELLDSLLDLVAMADFVAQRESGMDELKARIADARAAIAKAVTP